MFPKAKVDNIRTNLPFLKDALVEYELIDKEIVLFALSKLRTLNPGFEIKSETKSRFNTSPNGHPFDLYDSRKDLGNKGRPDGENFKGRGFIFLTGRTEYMRNGKAIGLVEKLIEKPELANDPKVASRIFALQLKQNESVIRKALLDNDPDMALRSANGGQRGLADFKEAFNIGSNLLK